MKAILTAEPVALVAGRIPTPRKRQYAGKRISAPYLFHLTKLLKPGTNTLEVRITPDQLNGFIGNARNDDKRYRQFKGKEDQVMSASLIGPVAIRPSM